MKNPLESDFTPAPLLTRHFVFIIVIIILSSTSASSYMTLQQSVPLKIALEDSAPF